MMGQGQETRHIVMQNYEAVICDGAGAAQVEHAGLPALQEEAGAEVGPYVDALDREAKW